jgi:hypothetical protein
VVRYTEKLPPDVGAAKLWLINRQPGRWREHPELEMTLSLEQKIAQMTPEQHRARLARLEAKMRGETITETLEVVPRTAVCCGPREVLRPIQGRRHPRWRAASRHQGVGPDPPLGAFREGIWIGYWPCLTGEDPAVRRQCEIEAGKDKEDRTA